MQAQERDPICDREPTFSLNYAESAYGLNYAQPAFGLNYANRVLDSQATGLRSQLRNRPVEASKSESDDEDV